jgi:hypothetical protein
VFSCTKPQIVSIVVFPTKTHSNTLSAKYDLKGDVTPKPREAKQKKDLQPIQNAFPQHASPHQKP